jgi:hypothetical protein
LNGSLDELLDCLDFAPVGVLGLIKDYAVKLEINDLSKREAIQNKLGLNVTAAIEINKANKETTEEPVISKKPAAAPVGSSNAPVRRVVTKK